MENIQKHLKQSMTICVRNVKWCDPLSKGRTTFGTQHN